MTDDFELDADLVARLRKAIANAIAETCRTDAPFIMIKFPEALDALVTVLTAMAGELVTFDDVEQVQALADAIGRRIITNVTAARQRVSAKTTPLAH
jgi:hypothetical protein